LAQFGGGNGPVYPMSHVDASAEQNTPKCRRRERKHRHNHCRTNSYHNLTC